MEQQTGKNQALTAAIGAVVKATLPTLLERKAAQQLLERKISTVIDQFLPPSEGISARQATLVVADLQGFNELADIFSAKIILDMLNRYLRLMNEVVIRFGGSLGVWTDQRLTVMFGIPEHFSDDVERALACAIAMQHAMATFNKQNKELSIPELYMGIGINSGEVLAGTIVNDPQKVFSLLGVQVDVANRVEAQSLRGQVLISENTYRLAASYILVGQPNSVAVKGVKAPVKLYELLGTTLPRPMTVPRREIRKSPRVAVNMPCSYTTLDHQRKPLKQCKAELLDVGYYGILILSKEPIEVFSEIKMHVSLSLLAEEKSVMYARVLNSERFAQGFRCSLEFTAIDIPGKQTIKQFVDSRLSG